MSYLTFPIVFISFNLDVPTRGAQTNKKIDGAGRSRRHEARRRVTGIG
jgi:hypothetical protein